MIGYYNPRNVIFFTFLKMLPPAGEIWYKSVALPLADSRWQCFSLYDPQPIKICVQLKWLNTSLNTNTRVT